MSRWWFFSVGFAAAFVPVAACSTAENDERGAPPSEAPMDGSVSTEAGMGADVAPNPASRPDPAAPKNGSRITRQRWRTADGAEVSAGLFDTKLGVACSPKFLTDDALHCVPEAAEIAQGPQYFADEVCTLPLAIAPTDCGPQKFVTRTKSSGVCADSEVFAVNSTYDADVSVQFTVGDCALSGRSTSATYYRFDPEKPLAPTEFVRFTVARRDVSSTLSARVYEGDDGSVVPTGEFVDTARSADCVLTDAPAIGSDVRCLPLSRFARATPYFADSECVTMVAGERSGLCDRTATYDRSVAVDERIADCGATIPHVFSLGTEVTSTVYSKDPTCSGPRPVAGSFTTVGGEIAAESFPALATTNVGGSRIQLLGVVAGDGAAPTAQLFDATTQLPCRFLAAADGKMRCLPYANFVSGWFRDSGCTQPVASVPTTCSASKYFTTPGTADCSSRTRVFVLGAPVQPIDGKLWFGAPSSCGRYTVSDAEQYFEPGPEASPELFAEAVRTDP